jgi:hypothetical protein
MGDIKIKSTTPAANRLCDTLTIIALRPPLLEKEGKVIVLNINSLTASISLENINIFCTVHQVDRHSPAPGG